MHGGRFNRPSTASFYTSLRLETAWLEAQQGFAFKSQPMTLCSYRIDCSDILDLTTDEGLAAALVTRAELACAWEVLAADRKPVPTWELADRLIEAGCAGIIVPSFAARAGERDINLVLWRWTAIDACRLGFKTFVVSDASKGIDLQGSLQHAWQDMLAHGVKRIYVKDIASLHEAA